MNLILVSIYLIMGLILGIILSYDSIKHGDKNIFFMLIGCIIAWPWVLFTGLPIK